MAESTTPPPPKSSNTGFVAAAVVMLLLMGGLIYWKVSGSKEPPKTTKLPPPPATTSPQVFDEPPPPPPPPPPPEDTSKPQQKRGGGPAGPAGPVPCGVCTGTAPGGLQAALRSKAGQARGCYERALRQNPMLQGKMTVTLKIGAGGQVCASSLQNGTGDPGAGSCVLSMFRSSTYPAPNGGCVDASVPLNFVPKQ